MPLSWRRNSGFYVPGFCMRTTGSVHPRTGFRESRSADTNWGGAAKVQHLKEILELLQKKKVTIVVQPSWRIIECVSGL